jgi:hypothetical protein
MGNVNCHCRNSCSILFGVFVFKQWWALAAVLLFIQSPVLLYYMPNFLPDAASLGLSLIAWWLFFKIIGQNQTLYFFGFPNRIVSRLN